MAGDDDGGASGLVCVSIECSRFHGLCQSDSGEFPDCPNLATMVGNGFSNLKIPNTCAGTV
jgi:hypothetical protein